MIGNILAGIYADAAAIGDFESISTVTGTGSNATITFTSIASTWQHLQIRITGRSTTSDVADNLFIRFNSDSASNYYWHYLDGDGASATSGNPGSNATRALSGRIGAANSGTNVFGVTIIDILDYKDANKFKTVRTLGGIDRNGAGNVRLDSGLWRSTSAITAIEISIGGAGNFAANTQIALYGIKG